MARGMVVGEQIISQANSEEFERGYERIFGDREPQRGRFVWDTEQGKLVPADEYRPPDRALDAPIMCDRFYEGVTATDGTDIGSRRKRRQYMRDNGLVDADDCKGLWNQARERRLEVRRGEHDHHERREQIGRALYEARSKRR